MKRKRLLFALLLALGLPWAANAQATLTVCAGTATNNYVPIYGLYVDTQGQNSEFIIPAETDGMSDLVGGTISKLAFYITNSPQSWGSPTVQVYMGEVEGTTLSSINGPTNFTTVWTGTLSNQNATMEITLSTPYTYNGGNLLIGMYVQTASSTYKSTTFSGIAAESGASRYNSGSGSGTAQSFIPKTTFTYTPAPQGDCEKPATCEVSDVTSTSATLTWSGGSGTYNVEVKGGNYTDWTEVLTGTNLTTTTLTLQPISTYQARVQSVCTGDTPTSGWKTSSSFTTPCDSYDVPYTYGFEEEAPFTCWTVISGNVSRQSGTTNNGTYRLDFRGTTSNMVALPQFTPATNTLRVEFYTRPESTGGSSGKFAIGYMTDIADASSFVAVETYNSTEMTTSYVKKTVDFTNAPSGATIAMRQFDCQTYYYWYVDDVTVKEIPSCVAPTALDANNITTNSAELSWTANSGETAWTLYWKKTTDETYTEVANATNPYTLNGLDAASTYQYYVVANCSADEASEASEVFSFVTECEAITVYPYTQNFDSYTAGAGVLPICWSRINKTTSTSYNGYPRIYNSYPQSTPNSLYFSSYYTESSTTSDPQDQYAILPEMQNLNGLRIKLYARASSTYAYYDATFHVGVMTDPEDETTFTEVATYTPTTTSYNLYTIPFDTYTGNGTYIAIKMDAATAVGTYTYGYHVVIFDDITVEEIPSCLEPTNLQVTANGQTATLTWVSEASAFDIAHTIDATLDPAENIVGTATEATYTMNDLALDKDHYFWVRANCGNNDYSVWVGPVSVHIGYCVPAPTSVDNSGITNVTFGTGDYIVNNSTHPASAPYYGDYTAQIGAVQAGVETTVAITYATGYTYNTYVWVDLDNSLTFDADEVVCYGESTNTNPTTLTLTFTIPADQTLGDYRMRIGGADSGLGSNPANANPCYSSTYGIFEDYTLRVLEAPDCMVAGDVTVAPENITSTSAVISWTNNNGDEATYTVMQGETVLTTTAVNSYTIEGLTAATTYPAGTFTIISDCDENAIATVPEFSTECDVIVVDATHPFTEGFESGVLSSCWDQDGYGIWSVGTGDGNTYSPVGAHTGSYNATITHDVTGNVTKLITPVLDLTSLNHPALTFWYINRSWGSDTDAFAVYYRTASDAAWTQIEATEEAHETWTKAFYMLPNPSATYQIAFEMTDGYGYGVGIDDVTIEDAYTLTIEGVGEENWEGGKSGYYLIASPVTVDLTNHDMTTGDFDLYAFNQAQDDEWRNYKQNAFSLEPGKGYLYAHKTGGEFTLTGTAYDGDGQVTLDKVGSGNWDGWNLVGNPFDVDAYITKPFYTLENSDTYTENTAGTVIHAMQGLLVVADNDGETLTFTTEAPAGKVAKLNMNVSRGRSVVDHAIISFSEGQQLPKLQFREGSTKVYIPMDGKDYAVVSSESMGTMPVNFKAEKNGSYTLSFNAEEVSFAYLHLIDNMTGAEVDLLANPSYTFEASTTDYESRFKLVFATGNNSNDDNFAFFSNGSFVINNEGEATLQVVDVMGRIIKSESINGCANLNVNAAPGVYMLRLVNGNDVKVQKVVVR